MFLFPFRHDSSRGGDRPLPRALQCAPEKSRVTPVSLIGGAGRRGPFLRHPCGIAGGRAEAKGQFWADKIRTTGLPGRPAHSVPQNQDLRRPSMNNLRLVLGRSRAVIKPPNHSPTRPCSVPAGFRAAGVAVVAERAQGRFGGR